MNLFTRTRNENAKKKNFYEFWMEDFFRMKKKPEYIKESRKSFKISIKSLLQKLCL